MKSDSRGCGKRYDCLTLLLNPSIPSTNIKHIVKSKMSVSIQLCQKIQPEHNIWMHRHDNQMKVESFIYFPYPYTHQHMQHADGGGETGNNSYIYNDRQIYIYTYTTLPLHIIQHGHIIWWKVIKNKIFAY